MTESEKLFLACLRFFFSKKYAEKELRQSLQGVYVHKVDWNLFLSLAELHGVIPLLYHSLNAVAWTNIPEGVRKRLEKAFLANLARNLFMSLEMDKVLGALAKVKVGGVPIKGVTLSEEVYPDISYRTAMDIDILIQKKDLKKAEKEMLRFGYHRPHSIGKGPFPENCYDLHLEKRVQNGRKVCVELHWNLAGRRDYQIPIGRWWGKIARDSSLREAAGKRGKYLTMGPEITLLYLTINAHNSRYLFLKQLVDIAQVARFYAQDMDWDDVRNMASELGLFDNLIFSLGLVQRLFHIRMWDGFARDLTSWKQRIFQYLFTERNLISGSGGQDLRQLLLVFLFDKKTQIAKSICRVLFPSKEAVAYRYNLLPQSTGVYLYWFLNPLFSLYRLLRGSVVNCWAGKGVGSNLQYTVKHTAP